MNSPKLTRRQMLALAGLTAASSLFPNAAFAEESLGLSVDGTTPPNPERMLMSVPESEVSILSNMEPSWAQSTTSGNLKMFLNGYGETYLNPAFKVIDVSEHNGSIDWKTVVKSGIDGAIIRLGFGTDRADYQLKNNIDACTELGIPYGVYLYSYAYDSKFAEEEALFTAKLIEDYGCKPTLPIFYDLEKWEWTGHTPPSDPDTYEAIVKTYCNVMASRGYGNVRVYSYRSYLNNELKSDYIWERAAWAAEYGSATLGFHNPYFDGCLAWQYTSTGTVPGVAGNVDINAFPPFHKLAFGDVTAKSDHHEDIWWLAENGISTGFPDGTFRPYSNVARCDMAAFLRRLAVQMGVKGSDTWTPSSDDWAAFSDIDKDTPHSEDILWLASTGISTGFPDGTFRPYANIARCDMAAFLQRLAKLANKSQQDMSSGVSLSDVNPDTPHYSDVMWLMHTGISTGFPDLTFRPYANVARCDMAAFLNRLANL